MNPSLYRPLDPLFQNSLRLALVSLLSGVEALPFGALKEKTGATAGNLSIQIRKLKDAGYVEVTKQFQNNYPQTTIRITEKGRAAFRDYAECIHSYLHPADPARPE